MTPVPSLKIIHQLNTSYPMKKAISIMLRDLKSVAKTIRLKPLIL